LSSYLDPSLKKYLQTDLKGGMRGLFLDDTQAFRLRLNNMSTQFKNVYTGETAVFGFVRKAHQFLNSAQMQMKTKFDNFKAKIDSINQNLNQSFSYGGYNFWIGTCNYYDNDTYSATLLDYMERLTKKIKGRIDGAAGGLGCWQGSMYIDATVTAAIGLRDVLTSLRSLIGDVRDGLSLQKDFMQTLVGYTRLSTDSGVEEYNNGLLGALRLNIIDLVSDYQKIKDAFNKLSTEVDALRNEISEKLTTKFPLPR